MSYARLKRSSGARKALLRDLVTDVILHERICTTLTKAQQIQPLVEKMISSAKNDGLHARRQAARFLRIGRSQTQMRQIGEKKVQEHQIHINAVRKLFEEIGPRFNQRHGGFTRIVKIGPRRGDGAMMAYCELV